MFAVVVNGIGQYKFPWKTAIIAAAFLLMVALLVHSCLRAGKGVKEEVDKGFQLANRAIDILPEIAQKFRAGTISQTFRESLPQVASTHGDVLELAVIRSDEDLKQTDKKTLAWDMVNLGTTVAEIRVPATYRYHLRLSDEWLLTCRSNVCLVLAPQIRPSLPVAIDTGKMEKRSESGWARFDKTEKLDELERSLTSTLELRASDPAHINLAREACRNSVAEFVKTWLLREDQWRLDRFTSIIVLFPDEAAVASEQDLALTPRDPTVRLMPPRQ